MWIENGFTTESKAVIISLRATEKHRYTFKTNTNTRGIGIYIYQTNLSFLNNYSIESRWIWMDFRVTWFRIMLKFPI